MPCQNYHRQPLSVTIFYRATTYSLTERPMHRSLTIEEVAVCTRVSPNTVRYWRKNGTGPPGFRLGRRVVFAEADAQAWILQRRAGARGSAA